MEALESPSGEVMKDQLRQETRAEHCIQKILHKG